MLWYEEFLVMMGNSNKTTSAVGLPMECLCPHALQSGHLVGPSSSRRLCRDGGLWSLVSPKKKLDAV